MEKIVILDRVYSSENTNDIYNDVNEAVDDVPLDNYGFHKGDFYVIIEFRPQYEEDESV